MCRLLFHDLKSSLHSFALFPMQPADFIFQPFAKIRALAAEGLVPIQAAEGGVACVFGVSGDHAGDKGFERGRVVMHPAVFAIFAAGFGVEHVQ